MTRNPLEDLLGDLTRGFWVKPAGFQEGANVTVKIDIREDDKNFLVRADIPGVEKSDIQVEIEDDRVSLRAQSRQDAEESPGVKTLYSERNRGAVSRSFTLPGAVESNAAKAQYKDGVLHLTLPKAASGTGRRVEVS